MNTKELGYFGEKLACEYLVSKGFNILGKNWRINFGEIDIIARKKLPFWQLFSRTPRPVHFVEVKTIIDSDGYFPEQRVDYKKQKKLRQLSQIWLSKNKRYQNYAHQIDIIGIAVNETTRNAKLHYFPNVVGGAS